MSLRMRGMLETELVPWDNEGGSVMIFLSLSPFSYRLIIAPSTYGYNTTWLLM